MYSFGNKQQNAAIVIVEMKSMANSSLVLEKKNPGGGLPWWLSGKESCQCGKHEFDPWSKEDPTCHGKNKLLDVYSGAQSHLTLWDLMDSSLPGSSLHGNF